MHPDVVTLPTNVSLGEFNLFRQRTIIDECFKDISKMSFGMGIDSQDEAKFLRLYGNLWLQFLIEKYCIESGKTIFLKSFVIDNIDLWKQAFPDSKIAVICRDGRDNVISSVKASNDFRSWHSLSTRLKKRFNYYSGRLFINHCRHWVATAKVFYKIEESTHIKKFKYEDLNNSYEHIKELLKYYDLKYDNETVENCLNAPVVGSSFGLVSKKAKPKWKPDYNKSRYVFTQKWLHWSSIKKQVFKIIAGKALIQLGYEKTLDW
jgi:hypothetical protein